MTHGEIDAAVALDPDESGVEWDWDTARIGKPVLPVSKAVLNMRVDQDVLDFFRADGKGYQTRINAVLRAYVEARKKSA